MRVGRRRSWFDFTLTAWTGFPDRYAWFQGHHTQLSIAVTVPVPGTPYSIVYGLQELPRFLSSTLRLNMTWAGLVVSPGGLNKAARPAVRPQNSSVTPTPPAAPRAGHD